jgi:hypothetical protein
MVRGSKRRKQARQEERQRGRQQSAFCSDDDDDSSGDAGGSEWSGARAAGESGPNVSRNEICMKYICDERGACMRLCNTWLHVGVLAFISLLVKVRARLMTI